MHKVKLRADAVGQYLLRKGCSQNLLATRLGISSGYCSQLIHGARCPSPVLREKLMRTLGTDFDALFESVT
jgi:transcriptional regulator with XRE-family HTH domain